MKAKDIMTTDVATATPETSLHEIAKMLVENDCGAIPILKSDTSRKPVGSSPTATSSVVSSPPARTPAI